MENEINPYVCKISGATFTKQCTVHSCFANAHNLNKSEVNAIKFTNCVYVDFHLAGFDETLDYAVKEQGFVGYRDLQYISPFLRTNALKLRDIYTNNVEMVRKAIALLWAIKSSDHSFYCKNCGHPTKNDTFQCVSATACNERRDLIATVLQPYLPAIDSNNISTAYNVLWRALTEKFILPISLSQDEKDKMNELRVKKL